jgi:hypothetical protein
MPAVSVANTMAKGITLHLSHQNNDTMLARHQTDTPVIYKGTGVRRLDPHLIRYRICTLTASLHTNLTATAR